MRRALVLACLLGCGRVGFDAQGGDGGSPGDIDDGSDGATACLAFSPWGPPVHDPILSTVGLDWGPTLSHDGLTLLFASDRRNVGGGENLFRATRATTTSPWTTPTFISEIDPGTAPEDPSLSADGLDLYWGNPAVSMATRASAGAMFSPVGQVVSSTTAISVLGGPDISPDGLTLLLTGATIVDGRPHMYEVHRSTTGDAWGALELPPGLGQTTGEQFGSYRGDLREVIFNEPTAGNFELFAATRATPMSAFGPATPVAEINSSDDEVDADLSDDGTTLFFASTRAPTLGSWDIWSATRTCL